MINFIYFLSYFCAFVTAKKKAVYDQFGEEGLKNGVPQSQETGDAWTGGYTFHGDADKVFREFFGGDNPFQGMNINTIGCVFWGGGVVTTLHI